MGKIKYILLLIALLFTAGNAFPQSARRKIPFAIHEVSDKKNSLENVSMSRPKMCSTGKGRRIKIQVHNADSIQIRRVRFLLYHTDGNKTKCIGKTWVSPLAGKENYSFCINTDFPLPRKEWNKLTFRLKRGKSYKDYKFGH